MNHRAKFDAASFILGEEIGNRTNTYTHTQTLNYNKNKQTVTDISTACLSTYVDNNHDHGGDDDNVGLHWTIRYDTIRHNKFNMRSKMGGLPA